MEIQGQDLCLGCMHELHNENTCSYCGLDQKTYHPNPRCLIPGTALRDRYMLGRVLGEGSFGITYIGWDMLLKLPVAIKEFFPTSYVSRDVLRGNDASVYVFEKKDAVDFMKQIRRFYKEAQVLSRFQTLHSIVSVRDFFYANDTAYMVMDYVEGISLKEYITQRGHLSGAEVLQLMKPVLKDLAKVHECGMIHRDISPDNLLVNEEGQLIVIDFGSARFSNVDWTKTITVMFKRGFSPEEQYHSKGKQGAGTDIYALCATMYYMLTGIVPEESVSRMIKDQVVPLDTMNRIDLSTEQKQAIMKGMSVEYGQRYATMTELLQALYDSEEAQKPKSKRRAKPIGMLFIAVIISFLLVTGAIKGYAVIRKKQSEEQKKVVESVVTRTTEAATTQEETETPLFMPSLTGLDKEQVADLLKTLNDVTFLVEWQEVESSTKKKGCVVKQSVPSGEQLKKDSQYTLTISLGNGKKQTITTEETATTQAVQQKVRTAQAPVKKKTDTASKKKSRSEDSVDFDGSIE